MRYVRMVLLVLIVLGVGSVFGYAQSGPENEHFELISQSDNMTVEDKAFTDVLRMGIIVGGIIVVIGCIYSYAMHYKKTKQFSEDPNKTQGEA